MSHAAYKCICHAAFLQSFVACCSYVAGLFASAHDTHPGVRKAVCTGLVQMLQLQPERLAPHMEQIIEYMLESTQVGPVAIGLDASI